MDFLWHSVSEKEKEDIKKQAKGIMDSFSKKLSSIKEKISEPIIERDDFERIERQKAEPLAASSSRSQSNEGNSCDEDFRKRMFDNAPNKIGDCIVAEKGAWT